MTDLGGINDLLLWFAVGMLGARQASRDDRYALSVAWGVLAFFAIAAAIVFSVAAVVERLS